jgi:hypothetical protein
MSTTSLFHKLKPGSIVSVTFGGGMEGTTTGKVTELIPESTNCRMIVEQDFWNPLSRQWHRKGETLIVHARELTDIL